MKTLFEKLVNYSFDMLAILDINGNFQFANRAFLEKLGWPNEELAGRSFTELMVFNDRENSPNMLKNLSRGHPIIFSDCQFKGRNNELHPIRWSAYPDLDVQAIFLVLHETDVQVTEQGMFKMAVEASPSVIFIVKDGEFRYANFLAEKVFGYSQDEFIGKPLEMLMPPRLHQAHQSHHARYIQKPFTRLMGSFLELPGLRKDGTEILLDIGLNPVYTSDGLLVVCSIIDITKWKQTEYLAEQKIQRLESEIEALGKLSVTDELTSLLNRRALFKHLELHYRMSQKESQPLSFIMADIDDFKHYNDTFGHMAGDEVLKQLADIMMTSFRRTDVICRYGGEEMAVILPATDANDAKLMGERLRKEIEEFKWPLRGITLSVGVATIIPRKRQTASLGGVNDFFKMADMALYSCKRSGKNKVVHFHDIKMSYEKQLAAWEIHHDTPPDH